MTFFNLHISYIQHIPKNSVHYCMIGCVSPLKPAHPHLKEAGGNRFSRSHNLESAEDSHGQVWSQTLFVDLKK